MDESKYRDAEHVKSYAGVRAKAVDTLPPWHPNRTLLRISEVPAFLKKLYGIRTSTKTVYMWRKYGVTADGRRIYLKTTTMAGARMVSKPDLMAFLKAM